MSMMAPPDPTVSDGGCKKHEWVDHGLDRKCKKCGMVCSDHNRVEWNGGQFCSICGKLWPKNV